MFVLFATFNICCNMDFRITQHNVNKMFISKITFKMFFWPCFLENSDNIIVIFPYLPGAYDHKISCFGFTLFVKIYNKLTL